MKQTIKLGNVYLDAVIQELPSRTAEVTDKPVESGQDISDHMQQKPSKISLSGTMVEDAAAKLNILKNYQLNAELLTYIGRNIFDNMVIERLDTDHAKDTKEGYHYDITLKQIRIAKPKTFQVKVSNPVTKQKDKKTATQVKKKTNSGRQQARPKKSYPSNPKRASKPIRAGGGSPRLMRKQKDEFKRLTTPPSLWKLEGIL